MSDLLKPVEEALAPVDLKEHPEADLSANAEKGAAIGGVAGITAGAIAGAVGGPGGALIGAVIGGVLGAVGTGVAVAAVDNQGEQVIRPRTQDLTDEAVERDELA